MRELFTQACNERLLLKPANRLGAIKSRSTSLKCSHQLSLAGARHDRIHDAAETRAGQNDCSELPPAG